MAKKNINMVLYFVLPETLTEPQKAYSKEYNITADQFLEVAQVIDGLNLSSDIDEGTTFTEQDRVEA